jgi:PAS domain S-box-containing protein
MGTLLLGIFVASGFASYRAVREATLEIGRERLRNLTQQLTSLFQQSSVSGLNRTFAVANDPVISAFLRSPSATTKNPAIAVLKPLASAQDPGNLQVELWNADYSLALTVPEGSSPTQANLETEFKQCDSDPFKAPGALRVINDVVTAPYVAAVKDGSGKPLGYLVRWRKISVNPAPQQLTDLLGDQATLYFGNSQGDVWTDLARVVPRPAVSLDPTSQVSEHTHDGKSVIALGRPISGTPWSVVIEISDQAFVSEASRFLRRMMMIGLGLLAIGIAGALFLSRTITRPLNSLTAAASAIRSGDYSHTVNIRQDDELGALARAFNKMVLEARDSQSSLERQLQERTLQLEAAPCAMLMVDDRGRIILVNTQMEQLFGYERAELLEQPIEMLVPDRYRTGHPRHREAFSEHPTARAMGAGRDLFGLRKDGSEVPIEIGLNPIHTDKGAFVLASIIDITERKRADERFRLVVEANPSAMLMVSTEGLMTLVNNQTEKLFGYSRKELLGQPVEMLVPERYHAAHPGHRAGFFQHPSTRAMGAGRDLYGLRKDGSEVPIEIGLNPIHTDEGEFVLASIIDITERKRSEQTFRQIIERAPYGQILVDEAGNIALVNAQIEESFGYMRDELLGQPIEMLVPTRFRAHHPSYRSAFIADPTARPMGSGRDLFGLRKDGSEFPVEIGLNPLDTEQGRRVLGTIIDITERKKADEAWQASEKQYRTLFENAPDGIVIADPESYYIDANASICRMLGYTREELIGMHASDIVTQTELEHIGPALTTIKSRSDYHREWQFKRKDGSVFAAEVIATMMPDGNLLGMIRDITERKQAEEKLRKSQEQLAGVIGSAMDAIITIDDEQRIILFNSAAERMFLFPSENAIGKPLDRFMPKRFRPTHKAHIEDFGRTHVTKRAMGSLGAIFGLRADGEEFPIEASISQLESEGRKFYTVILRDITERKRTEEALREQSRILDLAPVLIRDLSGRIIFWNTGAEQLYGWKSEEALDQISHQLLHTEFPRPLEEIKARLFANGDWEGELVHTKRDGGRLVVASHWVLHKNDLDEPRAVLEVNNDITERRRAEKEIHKLNEELEERVADRTNQLQAANKELEAFSYSVSHDLRAPLRHINGFSQALLEDYAHKLDETGQGYLQEVRSASQEMAQLIDDVLQLARVTRSEMRQEVVDLGGLANDVIAEFRKREPNRKVSFKCEEGLTNRGDKRLLRIVLTNLLGNAWKFTSHREAPEITFGSQKAGAENIYFVRDNGAGFDMAYAGKLFGAFQRLHTAGEFEGTGIGLATVQRVVLRHGGRVWAEGAVNQGATFYFTLADFKETENAQQSDLIS